MLLSNREINSFISEHGNNQQNYVVEMISFLLLFAPYFTKTDYLIQF